MVRRLAALVGLAASIAVVAGTAACRAVDLSKALTVEPVLSGYYDDGLLDGWNHLIPDLTFRIKNTGATPISAGIRLTVNFWFTADADGENDSIVLPPIEKRLAPGDETVIFQARAPHGFRLEGPRADLFSHSGFKDMTAKIFAQSHGVLYRLGDFPIDHQIIPHAYSISGHP